MKIEITRKDILWSYLSQIFQFGAGFLLLPVVLYHLSSSELALWYVFLSVTVFVNLLDFGFQPTIMRNISYIFSGAKTLAKEGTEEQQLGDSVHYELLFSVIRTVKRIYAYAAAIAFLFFSIFGTWYVFNISRQVIDKQEIMVAWVLYLISAVLNLYFFYYTPLLLGRGKIMESHKTIVFSKVSYMVISTILLFSGFGLIGIAIGNFIGLIVNRLSSHYYFYDFEIKNAFGKITESTINEKELFQIIWHNSKKMGLVTIGVFLILKTNLLIGGIFLPLKVIAAYGLTLQVFDFLLTVSRVFFQAQLPLFNGLMLQGEIVELRKKFLLSMVVGWVIYISGAIGIVVLGDFALKLFGSDTLLLPFLPLLLCVFLYLIEVTQGNCVIFITTANTVPFVNATLITGVCIFVLSFTLLGLMNMGVEGLFFSTIICQLAYNAWKWPWQVKKMLTV